MNIPNDLIIKRGSIFHSCEFKDIDHCKFFVIMGEDGDNYVGYFFINSNINPYIRKKTELFNMQVLIKRSDYEKILTHDSFIATHYINRIPKKKLSEQLDKGLTTYRGCLEKEDEERLLENLRNSDLYSDIEKESFFK